MPIHEFECEKCGKVEEVIFRVSDTLPSLVECRCGGMAKKIISRVNLAIGGPSTGDNAYPYLEENFGDKPVYVTAPEMRKKLMRERGLVDGGKKRGESGQWV
jgi:putative FmdB family regulatory protein